MASRFVRPDLPTDLAAIELVRVRLPLIEPFATFHGVEHERDLTLVHTIGADGLEGWGECDALSSATYSSEDSESSWRFLRDVAVPGVLAGDNLDVAEFPMAWAAVEAALLDARLRREGTSLATHVGATRGSVVCGAVVGRQSSIDALLEVVARRIEERAALIKLKIGPGWDVEPMRAVAQTFPGVPLAADANGAYTLDDRTTLDAIDALSLSYLEQPLAREDTEGFFALAARLTTPLALDESVRSVDSLGVWLPAGASVLNVKPARLGGISEAMRAIAFCAENGIGAFIGGMLEAGIGRAFALALAGIGSLTLPTDLGPSSRYFHADLTEPFELAPDGTIALPVGPGAGVVPQRERLDEIMVDRIVIRR